MDWLGFEQGVGGLSGHGPLTQSVKGSESRLPSEAPHAGRGERPCEKLRQARRKTIKERWGQFQWNSMLHKTLEGNGPYLLQRKTR